MLRVDIAEVYSPPRVTVQARRFQLQPGEAMDLTTGWDFRRAEDKRRAEQYVHEQKPLLLIGSPMCTMFSSLQRFTPWTEAKQNKWAEHRMHLRFVTELYRKQAAEGRLFLHEHPAAATSWSLQEVQNIMQRDGVHTVTADQCMFGLVTTKKGEEQHRPGREPSS